MNVLSPVTALVSAALPVTVGLLQGEHLSRTGLIGLPLALVAVVLVSAGSGAGAVRPSRTALLLAFGAGAAIALQLVFLHQAPSDSGVAPLIVGRAVSSAVTLTAAGILHRRLGAEKPAYAMSAAAGVLDSVANLLFLLAARSGDLTVVAVITALYPAGTVLLARGVLAERIHRGQLVGLGTAPVAVGRPPYGRMLSGIRGLRLDVTEVRAKFKYDDHKPVEQRSAAADRLTRRGLGLDVPTARQQLRRLDRIGSWKP
ncbi:EamA family transporter [Streptomyces sp. NPDC052309]|uniref:EamA family transporter n=1 Tax=Streptomyces sp. NPDC052309 TaxID=3155421 RepID=UPI0034294324